MSRCAYATGSMAALRQCDEDATHERVYLDERIPFSRRVIPCCFDHRFATGDEGRLPHDRGYEVRKVGA